MAREIIPVSINNETEKDLLIKLNSVGNRSDYIKKLIANDIYRDDKLYNTLERLIEAVETKGLLSNNNTTIKDDIEEDNADETLRRDFASQFD